VFTIRARKSGTARGKASASLAKQLESIARSGLSHIVMDTQNVYRTVVRRKVWLWFSVCVSRSNPIRRRRGFRRPPRSTFPLAGGEERIAARRGTPPLAPMSLGACRRCCRGGTPADASQMSSTSEGTPSSLLATSDVGPRTLNCERLD